MSIEAMSWVLKQDISRSSEKFILICLANYADERGWCYPSTDTLVRNTGQDRKTVMANLKRLCEGGLLRDTGHRVGRTKSVPIYELVGVPSNSAVHYVYRTTNPATGEYYIGMRSFNGDPALDTYKGSGRWVTAAQGKDIPLHKEILEAFETDVEASAAAVRLLKLASLEPLCRNEFGTGSMRNAQRQAAKQAEIAPAPTDPENGTASGDDASGPVFPPSSPVFPASSTVFSAKQSRKRDIESKGKHQLTIKTPLAPPGGPAPRGTRLANDWVLPKAWGLWALKEFPSWDEAHVRKTADVFKDYWTGVSGTRGVKLNWIGTWRNFCRNAKGPQKASGGGDGRWMDEPAVLDHGKRLGMTPNPGEQMSQFRARLQAAIDNGGKEPPPPRQSRVGITDPSLCEAPAPTGKAHARAAIAGIKGLVGRSAPPPRTNPPPTEEPPTEGESE